MKRTIVLSFILMLVLVVAAAGLAGCREDSQPSDGAGHSGGGEGMPSSPGADSPPQGADTSSPGPGVASPVTGGAQTAASEAPSGFYFTVSGLSVEMGAPVAPVVEALGEPLNYFEAPSCAFEGLDKIYYYAGFELYTFPVDGVDFVLSVNLTDDSVSTSEGVYLGMAMDSMVSAYGNGYDQNLGQYTYTLDDSSLSFLIEDGVITVITYNLQPHP